MSNPFKSLPAYDKQDDAWNVVIETPAGSRNKYEFDPRRKMFKLSSILADGMSFPYDFGFLPNTRGGDGDPLDVLLISDDPVPCGCLVPARLVGVIEARQTGRNGDTTRNDRLIAMPIKAKEMDRCRSLKQFNKQRLQDIRHFFESYNGARGKKFKVIAIRGPAKAQQLA